MSSAFRPVIGLVGQVCAGKSTVAEAFQRRGAWVYDADKIVAELYKDRGVVQQVQKMFGREVVNIDGTVNKKALAQIAFTDPAELKRLTQEIIFPRTGAALESILKKFREESDAPALILDAPTLFEAGRADVCDRILFVSAPVERRQEWSLKRGWDVNERERREKRLGDENAKLEKADAVIVNDGSIEHIEREVEDILKEWSAEAPARRAPLPGSKQGQEHPRNAGATPEIK
ncbi:MAG TPA: dephospho-CoA kinase [Planctomycetota bacterium]|nr:dephospho-CoA kinase [Planctomycetota bacterium]